MEEIYFSVDVESSGPIPSEFSMLSVGACVVGNTPETFYKEFQPISDSYEKTALEVCKLDFELLKKTGAEPLAGMRDFDVWIRNTAKDGRPVFVAFNATFDWQFVNYYFRRFLGINPFGISGLDIKAYYMGQFGKIWGETTKKNFDKRFLSGRKHTHNALDDAIEQAEIFEKLLDYNRLLKPNL